MNEQEHLKLQAYLDGELNGRERDEVIRLLDTREDARELMAELQNTRAALRGAEPERRLDCSREFYWSGIERGINTATAETPAAAGIGLLAWLRRHVAQVTAAAAAVCLITTVAIFSRHPGATPNPSLAESDWEVLHPGTGMMSYRDFENGITVVMLYDRTNPDFTSGQ